MIELVGAGEYARRPIGQCSGGEQQRLLIAQSLVRRPELLLAPGRARWTAWTMTSQASISALIPVQLCRSQGRRGDDAFTRTTSTFAILSYLDSGWVTTWRTAVP